MIKEGAIKGGNDYLDDWYRRIQEQPEPAVIHTLPVN